MHDQDHIWRDKFDEMPDSNENWLEPSESVFLAIEEEIYGDNKKRKKGAAWLWLIGLLPIIGLILFFLLTSLDTMSSSEEVGEINHNYIQEEPPTPNKSQKVIKETQTILEEIEVAKTIENDNLSRNLDNVVPYQKESNELIVETSSIIPTVTQQSPRFEPRNAYIKEGNEQSLSLENKRPMLSSLSLLKTEKTLELFSDNYSTPTHLGEIIVDSPTKFNFSILGSLGYTQWDLRLNQVFSEAVSPADFTYDNGNGYVGKIGMIGQINSRWSIQAMLGYQSVVFHSGHNSDYTFDAMSDTDNPTVPLTMATPFGFIEGSVQLESRSSGVASQDLVLDLDNRHKISAFDLSTSLGYTLYPAQNMSVTLSGGLMWQQILQVKNQLIEVKSSSADFSALDMDVSTSQASLQKALIGPKAGLSWGYNIGTKSQFFLSADYFHALSPIQKLDALSTDMYKYNVSVGYRLNLSN